MKIIYNNTIPFKGFTTINLFGTFFVRKNVILTEELLNHECIHTAQMKELFYMVFYMWYVIEWIVRLIQYKNIKKREFDISLE